MAGQRTTQSARKRQQQNSGYITAEQIEGVELEEEDVDVPEWGGKVRVRALSQAQVTALLEEAGAIPENGVVITDVALWQRLLVREGCINPKLSAAQVEGLADKAAPPIVRIATAVGDLSGVPAVPGNG
jgi:hypothetical protein